MLAEGDVDPQPVADADELVAAQRAHAEEHLELVLARPETGDERLAPLEQPLIVRGDPDVAALDEQKL